MAPRIPGWNHLGARALPQRHTPIKDHDDDAAHAGPRGIRESAAVTNEDDADVD